MIHERDLDPIRKSSRETNSFNIAWMKNGEKLTWLQRIGFAVFSFVFFASGVLFGTFAASSVRDENVLGAIGWSIPTLIFIIPGIMGLRNTLRFPLGNKN
jgi:hypothetical protein